jgi:hypothetical protein
LYLTGYYNTPTSTTITASVSQLKFHRSCSRKKGCGLKTPLGHWAFRKQQSGVGRSLAPKATLHKLPAFLRSSFSSLIHFLRYQYVNHYPPIRLRISRFQGLPNILYYHHPIPHPTLPQPGRESYILLPVLPIPRRSLDPHRRWPLY